MRSVKLSAIFLICACGLLVNGCNSELQDLRIQNDTPRDQIANLESELSANVLQPDQLQRQLVAANSELQDLRIQNDTQRERIAELESKLQVSTLQLEQFKRKFNSAQEKSDIEVEMLQQTIAALEEDIVKKKELIASMQERLTEVREL
ncbi:MAG: hypothetical protein ACYTBX_18235 [Planctomycetota bacterium]